MARAAASIDERARFDFVRYASCWEDADILVEALAPRPGSRILSIASAGDNSFALAAGGADVVAADLSHAQLALVELKRAAFGRLDYPDLLGFLGVRPSRRRAELYRDLRAQLPAVARAYWDGRGDVLARGVVHGGKFEAYFATFRERLLPLVHRRKTLLAMLERRDRAERIAFYERTWNNLRWQALFRIFFSRFVMGRLGRDPEFFRFVDGPVAPRILGRVRHAVTELATHDNPYLEYILTGRFEQALPRYLREEHFEAVQGGMARITLVEGPIQEAAAGPGFDGFNLSDLFEYLDDRLCEEVYGGLLAAARPGARFAYWNMLVPRRCPTRHASLVRSLDAFAAELFFRDRAFFYSAFVVEEVLPSPGTT